MNHLFEQKRQRVPYGDVWNKPFIYLGLNYCNAHLNKSFSKNLILALHIQSDKLQNNLYVGDPFFDIYQGTSEVLMKSNGDVRSIVNVGQRKAVEKLNEYVNNLEEGKKHVQCLGELDHQEKETIQAVLACHLFAPLLSEGKVFVDDKNWNLKDTSNETTTCNDDASRSGSESSVLEVYCPICKKNSIKADNTNFGCADLWHGRADIVIEGDNGSMREIVKIITEDVEEDEDEPVSKRSKLMNEDNLEDIKPEMEISVTSDLLETNIYVQAISQTILNSFLAVKLNKDLRNCYVPSFFVSSMHLYVNFYNVEKDILLVQDQPISIFDINGQMNYWAILSVWMALNFEKFPCKFHGDNSKKSGFQSWLQKHGVLQKYKSDITSKLTSTKKPEHKISNSIVNPMRVAELFMKLIQDENGADNE
ncbi:uncharacterized protein LOC127729148 [Mytilus californianus]|uniref:uncharacterized protein LOC127729148 n=1 Tax=Mytilus californianus TaxID=6549 RepID=UPI0022471486|nr:uncharacterized protein LOC127729148 [Mytilus californianus]